MRESRSLPRPTRRAFLQQRSREGDLSPGARAEAKRRADRTEGRRVHLEVVADIKKQLGLRRMEVINTGIYRPNLRYEVVRVTNEQEKHRHLAEILRETEGTGVVYCATVKDEVKAV